MAKQYPAPPSLDIDLATTYSATLDTNHGEISISLFAEDAPQTVNNFVFLTREGFYDGVIFHRVVPGFVIQGGDPTGTGRGGPGYTFRDELDKPRSYSRGTVAMANAGPNTNGSQFFICLADVGLPHSYTIFGEVTDGMDAVDAIAGLSLRGEKPKDDAVIRIGHDQRELAPCGPVGSGSDDQLGNLPFVVAEVPHRAPELPVGRVRQLVVRKHPVQVGGKHHFDPVTRIGRKHCKSSPRIHLERRGRIFVTDFPGPCLGRSVLGTDERIHHDCCGHDDQGGDGPR